MLAVRLLFWLASATVLTWALLTPDLRNSEGILETPFAFAVSAAVALAVLSGVANRRWRRAALWVALAVLGQAAMLQVIDAGKQIHYQHYRGWADLVWNTSPLLQGILLLQLASVVAGIGSRWRGIVDFLSGAFGPWRIAALTVVFALTAATVSRDIAFYAGELLLGFALQALNLANIILVAAALPTESAARLAGLLAAPGHERPDPRPRLFDRFSLAAAVWVVIAASLLSYFSYQRFPHVADEVVYLLPARYFSEGMLSMPSPPVREAFAMDLMLEDGVTWYSPVPPGWPALLMLGVIAGAPWIVNPLFAAAGILLLSFIVRRCFGPATGRLTVLLAATSPWYIFLAMSYMNHIATLMFALLSAASLLLARDTGKIRWAFAAGFGAGMMGLIRPLDAVLAAAAAGCFILLAIRGSLRWKALTAFAVMAVGLAVPHLAYNQHLNGDPLAFPLNTYFDVTFGHGVNDLGFGMDKGVDWEIDPYPGHTLRDVIVNGNLNGTLLNFELHGWGMGSLLAIAMLLFSGRPRGAQLFLWAIVAAVPLLYSLYWFSGGPDFGARYWFLMFFPLVTLSALGVRFLATHAESNRVLAAVCFLVALSVVNYLPWRAVDKYFHYRGMRPDLCRPNEFGFDFGRGLVLVRGQQHPDYMSAAACNPIDLSSDHPIFAWDRGPEVRQRLANAFPDRPIWVVDGPTLTGSGFRIVETPGQPVAMEQGQ